LTKGKDGKEKKDKEETYELGPEITTVLAVGFKDRHIGVIMIQVSERKVIIWDAARTRSHDIANYWMDHVVGE
jgi:hypothetical protein